MTDLMKHSGYPSSGDYQAAEVAWYLKNGRYPGRICGDSRGFPYVIGDDCWNRNRKSPEYIEARMKRDLGVI